MDDATLPPTAPAEDSSDPDALRPGQALGSYLLRERLGEGAFGAVFRAEQPALRREVAIKVLHARHAQDAQSVERFRREGMAAGCLVHPCAVRVFEMEVSARGRLWLAMELLEGQTLYQHLHERGSLSPDLTVSVLETLCEVLHEAHRKGVLHRDIKPANVMLTPVAGRLLPRLLDFGLAALVDLPALTSSCVAGGSPEYMAPEQWRGLRHADVRSDLYSLSVVAYECLSGQLPFQAHSALGYYEQHCHGAPRPLLEANPQVPAALAQVVMRGLSRDPGGRPRSAEELRRALRAALG